MTSFTFGDFDFGDLAGEPRLLQARRPTASRRDEVLWVPGRLDPFRFAQPPGELKITLSIFLADFDADARRLLVRSLYEGLVAQPAPSALTIDDEPDRYWRASLARDIAPVEIFEATDAFDVDFDCDPLAFDGTTDAFLGPGTFTPDPPIVVEQGCVVVLDTGSDPTFDLNGRTFSWTGTIPAGGLMVSSLVSGEWAVVEDSPDTGFEGVEGGTSQMAGVDPASLLPRLIPGENELTFTGAATCAVGWRRRSP